MKHISIIRKIISRLIFIELVFLGMVLTPEVTYSSDSEAPAPKKRPIFHENDELNAGMTVPKQGRRPLYRKAQKLNLLIQLLPQEMIVHVTNFLTIKEGIKFASTCKFLDNILVIWEKYAQRLPGYEWCLKEAPKLNSRQILPYLSEIHTTIEKIPYKLISRFCNPLINYSDITKSGCEGIIEIVDLLQRKT